MMNDITRFNKLTAPENQGEYKIESLKKTEDEILFLYEYQLGAMARFAYFIGQRLITVKKTMEYGKFSAWLDKTFPFSRKTAYRYMSFYEKIGCVSLTQLEGLTMTQALEAAGFIEPKKPRLENAEGLNRIDLGGDPGQITFDFNDLFKRPADTNPSLKNYRTVADLLDEIIVVRQTSEGGFISKRIVSICEDIPQGPTLRHEYGNMTRKIQEAVEKYLAAREREEE
jgi:hypothetical protein